jgi:membrane-bound lytic murein transglycosylase B
MFASAAADERQPAAVAGPVGAGVPPPSAGPGPGSGSVFSGSATGSPAARLSVTVSPKTGSSSDPVAAWAAVVSSATGIPARAVQGYGYAELVLKREVPGCHLHWNTLAGVGMVESDHGRYGGAALAADGTETRAVIGPALDGSPGRKDLPAADHGVLTGDPVHDHAVGPMQLLPETWYEYAGPGLGASPQNIDNAAIAAGRYLCADGRDLSTGSGWWAAIYAYNHSTAYANLVYHYADAYAHDAR